MCMCMCIIMCMCLYVFVCVCVCMRMCVDATAGAIIRILVWSDKCQSKQEVGWSSADITSMGATNQLLAS